MLSVVEVIAYLAIVFWVTFPLHLSINMASGVERPAIPAVLAATVNVVGFGATIGLAWLVRLAV